MRQLSPTTQILYRWNIDREAGLLKGEAESSEKVPIDEYISFESLVKNTLHQSWTANITVDQDDDEITPADAAGQDTQTPYSNTKVLQNLYLFMTSQGLDFQASKLLEFTASEAQQRAIDVQQEIVKSRKEDLALSWSALGSRLKKLERLEEAATAGKEVVEIRRKLVDEDRAVYLPTLGASLGQLAAVLKKSSSSEDAVKTVKEATEIYLELVERDRETYLLNLAQSYNQLADCLRGSGTTKELVEIQEKAVALWRELVEKDRARHLDGLAFSIKDLADTLQDYVPGTGATKLLQEYLIINQEIRARIQQELTHHIEEALKRGEEAITAHRISVAIDRETYLPKLANSLSWFADILAKRGNVEEAVVAAEEAVDIYKELMIERPIFRNCPSHIDFGQSICRNVDEREKARQGNGCKSTIDEISRYYHVPDTITSMNLTLPQIDLPFLILPEYDVRLIGIQTPTRQ
ncbi:hypothetical protein FRC02_001425 [Tulasnella sp. 418]|nr:hypothetical protein FRC02_001425 [Tulasnella sp. 418]